MTGKVCGINPLRGLVAIVAEQGGCTIIELLGDDPIELGDAIEWDNDTAVGEELYRNHTRRIRLWVDVRRHDLPRTQVRQQLLGQ
jgi:hypothetical protein